MNCGATYEFADEGGILLRDELGDDAWDGRIGRGSLRIEVSLKS